MGRHLLVRLLGVVFALVAPFEFAVGQRVPAAMPAGTEVQVRIIEQLSSDKAREGDTFRGTLQRAIAVKGKTQYPRGADVVGKVLSVHPSGRLSDPGELELTLTAVRVNGSWYPVNVQPFLIKGESHAKNNVGKIGGGALAGAVIGGIAGGGKGAAIGAGVGAGAGTTMAAATGKKEAKVESEAILTWVALAPVVASNRPDDRYRDDRDDRYRNDRDDRYRRGDRDQADDRYDPRRRDDGPYDFTVFSERDRRVIRSCFVDERSSLPPGLAKKDRLPPGLERQLQRNGTLPPGLQKRVQPLPAFCDARLPRLPAQWGRVVISGRVLLLDPGQRILDVFMVFD